MSNGKAPGRDEILAKIFTALSIEVSQTFHGVLTGIWEREEMPFDLRYAIIVALVKNKGSRADFGNHRGISLLSIARKILAYIMLNRLIPISCREESPPSPSAVTAAQLT